MEAALSIDPSSVLGPAAADLVPGGRLWVRGRGAVRGRPALAVVGARAASQDGRRFAFSLSEEMARRGWTIVSGGALGIDGAAHEGALAAAGRTVAVLGTGVEAAYPVRHAPLFARILAAGEHGVLVSPFAPGTHVRRWNFPARNPIIAGLADATVVVEASVRSGSLGTARAARRLGRPLYARAGSPGCDALLAAGEARPVADVAPLVAALAGEPAPAADPTRALPPLAARALGLLDQPLLAEEVARQLALPLGDTLAILCELELSRVILRTDRGRYLALAGPADLKE